MNVFVMGKSRSQHSTFIFSRNVHNVAGETTTWGRIYCKLTRQNTFSLLRLTIGDCYMFRSFADGECENREKVFLMWRRREEKKIVKDFSKEEKKNKNI